MTDLVFKTTQSLGKAMREKDVDEIKILKDKMEREQAKKLVEEAKEKTDDLKKEIFDQAKQKEAAMKLAEEEKAK
jgi:hypothetical protein